MNKLETIFKFFNTKKLLFTHLPPLSLHDFPHEKIQDIRAAPSKYFELLQVKFYAAYLRHVAQPSAGVKWN